MIKVIKKSENKIVIETDMPITLANAIRRSVNYVPILAIDNLEISKNDSALYDEIIANRMGLMPLKNEQLKLPEECDCKEKGCVRCSMKLKLKAEGPKIVYSDEMTPDISVYKMPITILDKNQELELVAIAKMGLGVTHTKYSPGLIYYRYSGDDPKKTIKEDEENFKKILENSKKEKNTELILAIESWGQLSPKELFVKSIESLNKNLRDFIKLLK